MCLLHKSVQTSNNTNQNSKSLSFDQTKQMSSKHCCTNERVMESGIAKMAALCVWFNAFEILPPFNVSDLKKCSHSSGTQRLAQFVSVAHFRIHVQNHIEFHWNWNWNWNHVRFKHIMLAKRKTHANQQVELQHSTAQIENECYYQSRISECNMCIQCDL